MIQEFLVQIMISNKNELETRLKTDATSSGFTVEKFVEKILDQCKEVLKRHEEKTVKDFQKPEVYRVLEMEMMEVKVFSIICGRG